MFLLLGLPFLLIAKIGAFKRRIEDYCDKIIRAFGLYFIKIFINFFNSYINARFKEEVVFVFKI